MEELDVAFNRPIPGTAMTHEVGARPWQIHHSFLVWKKCRGLFAAHDLSRVF